MKYHEALYYGGYGHQTALDFIVSYRRDNAFMALVRFGQIPMQTVMLRRSIYDRVFVSKA